MMKYKIRPTKDFKRDLKNVRHRGYDLRLTFDIKGNPTLPFLQNQTAPQISQKLITE
jgi:hypothetical protein